MYKVQRLAYASLSVASATDRVVWGCRCIKPYQGPGPFTAPCTTQWTSSPCAYTLQGRGCPLIVVQWTSTGIGSPPWTVPSAEAHTVQEQPLSPSPYPGGWVGPLDRVLVVAHAESAAEDPGAADPHVAGDMHMLLLPCCARKQSCNVPCCCSASLPRDETLPCDWSGTEHSTHHGHIMMQQCSVSMP